MPILPLLVLSSNRGPINVPGINQAPLPLRVFVGADLHAFAQAAMAHFSVLTNVFGCYPPNELYLDHMMLNYKPHTSTPSPLFCFFRATHGEYGNSKARGRFRAVASCLHHSHSKVRSQLQLTPTMHLTAMLDP